MRRSGDELLHSILHRSGFVDYHPGGIPVHILPKRISVQRPLSCHWHSDQISKHSGSADHFQFFRIILVADTGKEQDHTPVISVVIPVPDLARTL